MYDTVQKLTVLPLQEMKKETMMILKKKKLKLTNEDYNTRRSPYSTLEISLTAVKVAQYRQVAANRRETEESKNITSKKTSTRKVHLQLNRYEDFDMRINSMNSISLSTTDEDRFIQLIQQSSNTIKDAFVLIRGKLGKLPNQIRDTLAIEMIHIMN